MATRTYYFDDSADNDELLDDGNEEAPDDNDEDEEAGTEDLGDIADDLDDLHDRAQEAGASPTALHALAAISSALRQEGRTNRPTSARQLSEDFAFLLAETGGAGVYPDRDAAGNPRSKKGSIEERVQRQIQAQQRASRQQTARQRELNKAAPDLTPEADRLARQRFQRSISEMATDPTQYDTVQRLYREAELAFKKRQGLG